jgi:hypothetical protein
MVGAPAVALGAARHAGAPSASAAHDDSFFLECEGSEHSKLGDDVQDSHFHGFYAISESHNLGSVDKVPNPQAG